MPLHFCFRVSCRVSTCRRAWSRWHDVSAAYRRFGHEVQLERHLYTPEQVASHVHGACLREVCRLLRRAQGTERDDQSVLLFRVG